MEFPKLINENSLFMAIAVHTSIRQYYNFIHNFYFIISNNLRGRYYDLIS
jgi:hypothetical protein